MDTDTQQESVVGHERTKMGMESQSICGRSLKASESSEVGKGEGEINRWEIWDELSSGECVSEGWMGSVQT